MQYDFDKKEAKIKADTEKQQAIAAAKLSDQKIITNISIAAGILFIIAGAIIFIAYKRKRDTDEKLSNAEFNTHIAETEMKALRAQMNPHFIFNSLNSISDYIQRHDIKKADEYLTAFARLMRHILENSENSMVKLADDIYALQLYMELEALRLNKKFEYNIIIDESIDKENTLLPPLILQPFVENSIWHGLTQKEGIGKIKVHIKKRKQYAALHCGR